MIFLLSTHHDVGRWGSFLTPTYDAGRVAWMKCNEIQECLAPDYAALHPAYMLTEGVTDSDCLDNPWILISGKVIFKPLVRLLSFMNFSLF